MARKKKEETAEEVKTTTRSKKNAENKPTTTTYSKYGFHSLQENAKLKNKGLRDTVK